MNQRRSMKPLIGGVDRVAWSQWRKSQADKHAIKSAIEGAAFVADLRFELLAAYTGAVLAPRRRRKPRWASRRPPGSLRRSCKRRGDRKRRGILARSHEEGRCGPILDRAYAPGANRRTREYVRAGREVNLSENSDNTILRNHSD
jgi:hypothetical protein